MLRLDGERMGVLASGMRVVVVRGVDAYVTGATERGVGVFLVVIEGRDDGGWFSASDDWGDADGISSRGGGVGGVGDREGSIGALPLACLDFEEAAA